MTTTRGSWSRLRPTSVLVVAAFALLTLAGCGDDDGSTAADPGSETSSSESATPSETPAPSETTTPEPPAGPACDEVWVDGAKLPGGYQQCFDADGKKMKMDGRYCEFGKPLITYADSFWAVPGGPVHEVEAALLDDPDYAKALAQCSG